MSDKFACEVCGDEFDTQRGVSLHKGQVHSEQKWRDKELMERLYLDEKKNIYEIAEFVDSNPVTVHKWLNRHGIERRSISESQRLRHGTEAPVSLKIHRDGYPVSHFYHENEYFEVRIHRLAAVAWYGFDEVVGKDVHHKNNIPWDNREENLEPMTPSEHMEHHAKYIERNEQGEIITVKNNR